MAESLKDIWTNYKNDLKKGSAKINAEGKARREAIKKPSMKEVSGSRKLWAVWLAILTAPLLLFALFLVFVAGVIIWTMF